jgi:hypothetical protein
MADVSFFAQSIGLGIPFSLHDGGLPLSNAISAVVTWRSETGTDRVCSMTSAASAVFTYVTTSDDFRYPTHEQGQLVVSIGNSRFFTSHFSVRILAPLRPLGGA